MAYASANRPEAGASLDKLEKMAADNPGLQSVVRTGRAMMLHQAGQHDEALSVLGEPEDNMGQAVGAECLKAMKRGAEAKKMKTKVLGNPNFSFYDPIRSLAVLRASKV